MTISKVWDAVDPAAPFLMWIASLGLINILDVQSTTEAVLLGAGFSALMLLLAVWLSRRGVKFVARPWLRPRLLPWGIAFTILGAAVYQLAEPWKYWGIYLLANGILYVVSGALASLRGIRSSAS